MQRSRERQAGDRKWGTLCSRACLWVWSAPTVPLWYSHGNPTAGGPLCRQSWNWDGNSFASPSSPPWGVCYQFHLFVGATDMLKSRLNWIGNTSLYHGWRIPSCLLSWCQSEVTSPEPPYLGGIECTVWWPECPVLFLGTEFLSVTSYVCWALFLSSDSKCVLIQSHILDWDFCNLCYFKVTGSIHRAIQLAHTKLWSHDFGLMNTML